MCLFLSKTNLLPRSLYRARYIHTDYVLYFYGRFNEAVVLSASRKLLIDCVLLSCAYISGW